MDRKSVEQKPEDSKELTSEDADKLYSVLALCTETHSALSDFGKKLKQIIEFHEEEIKKGNDFFSGKNRLEILGNIKSVQDGLGKASAQVKQLVVQARQMLPLTKVPTLGVGGAREADEGKGKDEEKEDSSNDT